MYDGNNELDFAFSTAKPKEANVHSTDFLKKYTIKTFPNATNK